MISSCFTRRSFQNVHQPWWTVYNDFYPVATDVSSNLLSLAWRLRLHHIVGSNDPKPDPIYASLRLAFHPKCALSACKCIAQYRLKFQIIHCQFFFWIRPCQGNTFESEGRLTRYGDKNLYERKYVYILHAEMKFRYRISSIKRPGR